jgi:hypothetical protein
VHRSQYKIAHPPLFTHLEHFKPLVIHTLNMAHINSLPVEVVLDHILPYLPISAVLHLSATCKSFYEVTSDETFWKRRLLTDYNFSGNDTARTTGWKFIYKRLTNPKVYVWGCVSINPGALHGTNHCSAERTAGEGLVCPLVNYPRHLCTRVHHIPSTCVCLLVSESSTLSLVECTYREKLNYLTLTLSS